MEPKHPFNVFTDEDLRSNIIMEIFHNDQKRIATVALYNKATPEIPGLPIELSLTSLKRLSKLINLIIKKWDIDSQDE